MRKEVDESKQIVIKNAHPAIISQDVFDSVQALMKAKGQAKSNGRESLFANIAVCGDCGLGMHFRSDRRNGAYVCGGYVKHTSMYCTSHIIEEKKLLEAVKNDITSLVKDHVSIEQLYGTGREKSINCSSIDCIRIKKTGKAIRKAESTI
nr:recombinase zinc beta ribbon domain-containing protein [Bacillus subtilis]